ncbi:GNAT family N-acetyltransferase [Kitasatospora sp. NPDC059463]|uniref:GNAT family N-acetyltransferase n=1 Tax=unclassified Kitasatospora TaxID=2633591 RepID=UPI003678C595
MLVRTTRDTEDFATQTGGWIAADPVANSILLTLLKGAQFRPPAAPPTTWSRVEDPASDGSPVVGAAAFTPPHPVVLSGMPAAAAAALGAELGAETGAGAERAPGVIGADPSAAAFAGAWSRATGRSARADRREHLLSLDGPAPAEPRPAVPGRSRAARPEESELFTDWCLEAAHGAGLGREIVRRSLRGQIAGGLLRVWEEDGQPVAVLGRTAAVAGVTRFNPLCSRPGLRHDGCARALLGEAVAALRADGLTGLAVVGDGNPAARGLFESFGFRRVGGLSEYRFD